MRAGRRLGDLLEATRERAKPARLPRGAAHFRMDCLAALIVRTDAHPSRFIS